MKYETKSKQVDKSEIYQRIVRWQPANSLNRYSLTFAYLCQTNSLFLFFIGYFFLLQWIYSLNRYLVGSMRSIYKYVIFLVFFSASSFCLHFKKINFITSYVRGLYCSSTIIAAIME